MLATVIAELWPFFRETFFAALVVPSIWLPKNRLVGNAVTFWASAARQLISTEHTSASSKFETLTRMLGHRPNWGRVKYSPVLSLRANFFPQNHSSTEFAVG